MYLWDPHVLEGFILAFLRTVSAVSLMPVFGYNTVPVQIKAAIGFVLAVVIAPVASDSFQNLPPGILPIAGYAISEVIVGMIFGLVTILIMVGAEFAGSLVGIQMGFGIVNIMDPQFGHQVSLVGRLEYLLALAVFLALDMHLPFLEALADTFKVIPIGGAVFKGGVALNYAHLSAEVFVIAIKLASPVIAMLFVTEISLGIIARVVPQMNVFIVGFPLKVGVGMLGLAASLPLFVYVVHKVFIFFELEIRKIMILVGGG